MNNNDQIISAAISDRGLSEKRPQNEDSFLEMGKCGIYAVADGVGGAQAGEVASQMAVEILGEAFANRHDNTDAETIMRSAIEQANASINQMASELPQLSSMATTIVSLHLAGNIATIGHVGDSRLYRLDRTGILHRDTNDHSVVAEEVRAGRMSEEQAENHPSRNIISRALGAEPTVRIDLKTIMVDPGTTFLICSDGITRHINDEELERILNSGGAPAEICNYLKNLCYDRGAEDNLTAVVVRTAADVPPAKDAPGDILEFEEPTLASIRSTTAAVPASLLDDELLELEPNEVSPLEIEGDDAGAESQTVEMHLADVDRPDTRPEMEYEQAPYDTETAPPEPDELEDSFSAETLPAIAPVPIPAAIDQSPKDVQPASAIDDLDLASYTYAEQEPSGIGKFLGAIGLVLLGAVIGFAVFHFTTPQPAVDTPTPQISEMKTDNIPLSAFEDNRRNVDKDPAGYIAKFGTDPQDSEDYYLLGRAYMLTNDFSKAKTAFSEAQKRLGEADPVNAKVLASDLAMAIAVTNNPTIQSILKKELDGAASRNANTNSASNR